MERTPPLEHTSPEWLQGLLNGLATAGIATVPANPAVVKQVCDATRETFQWRNGLRGVFANLAGNSAFIGASQAAKGISYSLMLSMGWNRNRRVELLEASAIGGASAFTVVPSEMTSAVASCTGWRSRETAKRIYAAHGVRGLYRGVIPTLWRDIPAVGANLTGGVMASRELQELGMPPMYAMPLGGFLAGACTSALTQPFQVLRIRMQTDPSFYAHQPGKTAKYVTLRAMVQQMWNQSSGRPLRGRISPFFLGYSARLIYNTVLAVTSTCVQGYGLMDDLADRMTELVIDE